MDSVILLSRQLKLSIKIMLLLVLLILAYSCQDKSIVGHWHIHTTDFLNSGYLTLDILPDSVAILNRYASDGGVVGSYSIAKKEILIPGECGVGHFKYHWDGNDLFLENYLENRKAVKCDSRKCDLSKDVLIDSRLQVSLPQVILNRDCLTDRYNERYAQRIIIGKPSPIYYSRNVIDNRLELDGQIATIEDLPIWMNEIKKRAPDGREAYLSFQIFADQNITAKELIPLVNQLLESGGKRIFIATLNPNFETGGTTFEYVPIRNVNLKSALTLGELLY